MLEEAALLTTAAVAGAGNAPEALVLVAHGADGSSFRDAPAQRLAERLRARHGFAAIEAAFVHGTPGLADVLDRLEPAAAHVVPLFAGEGCHTRAAIPAAIRESLSARAWRFLRQTPALGTHPAYIRALATRVRRLVAAAGIDPAGSALLAVGHGYRPSQGTGDAAARLVSALRPAFSVGFALYLEGDPPVLSWPALTGAGDIVVVPVFFNDGRHACLDLPRLFGLPELPPPRGDRILGPWPCTGRRLWYASAPPTTDCTADAVTDLARIDALCAG